MVSMPAVQCTSELFSEVIRGFHRHASKIVTRYKTPNGNIREKKLAFAVLLKLQNW